MILSCGGRNRAKVFQAERVSRSKGIEVRNSMLCGGNKQCGDAEMRNERQVMVAEELEQKKEEGLVRYFKCLVLIQ